eukprot:m.1311656 g.1311656  ORF g.1311656 m.1311656 type:complete len:64 (-) comp24829_c1_seq43:3524-3715(-)
MERKPVNEGACMNNFRSATVGGTVENEHGALHSTSQRGRALACSLLCIVLAHARTAIDAGMAG